MTGAIARAQAAEIIERLGLKPLPVEGGLFVQTWRSAADGDIAGTATYAAFTDDPDSFSAMHRLPVDEVWHFYLGDPLRLLLLHDDGRVTEPLLGADVLGGQSPQLVVPAGTWMGARLAPGGTFALFGNTMAPGFRSSFYEGGRADALVRRWPEAAERIRDLTPADADVAMPDGL